MTHDTKTHNEVVTLSEFIGRIPNTLDQFIAATIREFGDGDKTMDPDHPMPEAWWWREVAAWMNAIDQNEEGANDGNED